ncbi:MAG: cysteine peptidase family C39 domain-containing protein, partial [Candidatus Tectomicrobia bacterium]|nr:cysteine peptidase family C39 domain-containing protein [Candidatus Tectomicrobia bacterium]
MTAESAAFRRPFFAPEVIQTSAMDCGPAVLKCLLDGFGRPVSYGRLREACQTDVDGTSIDTLEDIARQLGLDVQQTVMPRDHLVLPEAKLLPALVVVLQPNGSTHFVVAWRLHGPWVQVMDPGTGRRWVRRQRFLSEVYWHTHLYPAILWRAWAGTEAFTAPLRQRLEWLGLDPSQVETLIDGALEAADWRPLAALDAATRLTASIVQTGQVGRGAAVYRLVSHFLQRAFDESPDGAPAIPDTFWSVRPESQADAAAAPGVEQLRLQGAVLLQVRGRRATAPAELSSDAGARQTAPDASSLPPNLAAALAEAPPQPLQHLWRLLRAGGLLAPGLALLGIVSLAAGTILQAPLLQRLMLLAPQMLREVWRLDLLAVVLAVLLSLLLLNWSLISTILRLGRQLEARLRLAFLSKIPRLGDRYFHSRLTSDMAQRAYSLRQIRLLPSLGLQGLSLVCQLLFTTIGICLLAPAATPVALVTLGLMLAVGVMAQPALTEADLRARTHDSALSRFHLDALQGLIPLRAHSAESALRREHESLLSEWGRASRTLVRWQTAVQTLAMLIGAGGTIAIVFTYLA